MNEENKEYGIILSQKSQIDLNSPFAPGTYVELKLKDKNNENLNWGFVECDSWEKKEMLLKYDDYINNDNFEKLIIINKPVDLKHNARYENDTLAFSLPITRSNEPTEDIKNYQYYIVVFAYSSEKALPNKNDPKIIIDMSFRVGVGKDEEVSEIERKTQQELYNQALSNNLKAWNKLQCICNVNEAVGFLRANNKHLKDFYNNNKNRYEEQENDNYKYDLTFEYFRTHPQLAGKIAYIYYRFDLGDEEFVRSVEGDNGEYVRDREHFTDTIANLYTNIDYRNSIDDKITHTKSYEQDFESAFIENNTNIDKEQLLKDFINSIGKALGIREECETKQENRINVKITCMTEIEIREQFEAGIYNKFKNKIYTKLQFLNSEKFTKKDNLIYLLDNIIHEFRHFYIYYIFGSKITINNNLLNFVFYSMDNLYISPYFRKLFDVYHKKCAIFDTSIFNCNNKQGYSLYFTQPSERDSRMTAYKFRKSLLL